MSAHVITYERGTTYVKEAGTTSTALVGQLYVGGSAATQPHNSR